eukprot:9091810-Ditylum_brightwellii.AAC.1
MADVMRRIRTQTHWCRGRYCWTGGAATPVNRDSTTATQTLVIAHADAARVPRVGRSPSFAANRRR